MQPPRGVVAGLAERGDIADVMEVFGVKRVARYSFRSFITRAITVERAAKIHRVPLDEFLDTLRTAVGPESGSRGEQVGTIDPGPSS